MEFITESEIVRDQCMHHCKSNLNQPESCHKILARYRQQCERGKVKSTSNDKTTRQETREWKQVNQFLHTGNWENVFVLFCGLFKNGPNKTQEDTPPPKNFLSGKRFADQNADAKRNSVVLSFFRSFNSKTQWIPRGTSNFGHEMSPVLWLPLATMNMPLYQGSCVQQCEDQIKEDLQKNKGNNTDDKKWKPKSHDEFRVKIWTMNWIFVLIYTLRSDLTRSLRIVEVRRRGH